MFCAACSLHVYPHLPTHPNGGKQKTKVSRVSGKRGPKMPGSGVASSTSSRHSSGKVCLPSQRLDILLLGMMVLLRVSPQHKLFCNKWVGKSLGHGPPKSGTTTSASSRHAIGTHILPKPKLKTPLRGLILKFEPPRKEKNQRFPKIGSKRGSRRPRSGIPSPASSRKVGGTEHLPNPKLEASFRGVFMSISLPFPK